MDPATMLVSTAGGALIGLASAGLLLFDGKIAGISGISGGLLASPPRGDLGWRLAFVLGLLLAGGVGFAIAPMQFAYHLDRSLGAVVLAGVLVGFGARLGGGCTSGHGVCGVGRFSTRSMIATATFMATGAVVVFLVNHVLGGAL